MNGPTRTWKCSTCNRTVERWPGEDDVQCECGALYNCFGQRLRDDLTYTVGVGYHAPDYADYGENLDDY